MPARPALGRRQDPLTIAAAAGPPAAAAPARLAAVTRARLRAPTLCPEALPRHGRSTARTRSCVRDQMQPLRRHIVRASKGSDP
ncbi:hypothetical protein GCM10009594_04270 [Kocuria palustris]